MIPQPEQLPIVDFSTFIDPCASEADKHLVAQQIDHACQTFGFFYLVNHGIMAEELQRAIDLAHSFFQLPLESKRALSMKLNDYARGYAGIGGEKTNNKRDVLESLDWFRTVSPGEFGLTPKLLGGKNMWPEEMPELEVFFNAYSEKLRKLGAQVLDALVMASGSVDVSRAKQLTSDPFWYMRLIGYPPLSTFDKSKYAEDGIPFGSFSLGEHTDYGCLTLLNQDPSVRSTLQVKLLSGEWIDANPIPGAFVVNVGDMLSIWTNGRYKSTPHRVVHRGEKYRVSVPFFYEPNFDSVNTSLTRESNDKKVTYGAFLKEKYVNNYGHQDPLLV